MGMRERKYIIIVVILMAIGFASVSTTLFINGSTNIGNNRASFIEGVIFTSASTESGSANISQDGKEITFSTTKLMDKDETAVLDFVISNLTDQYDVSAIVTCGPTDITNAYNGYVSFETDEDTYNITSGDSVTGYATATLTKVITENQEVEFKCTIEASAVERTSIGNVNLRASDVTIASPRINEINLQNAIDSLASMLE